MKSTLILKASLFWLAFVCISPLSAQTAWEKYTIIADSLDREQQFEKALPYRVKALKAAGNKPDSLQNMLQGLQLSTQAEYDFSQNPKKHPEAYARLSKAADVLQKASAPSERMSETYHKLSGYAFDYMHQAEDAEKFSDMAYDYAIKSSKKDTLHLIGIMEFSSYVKTLSRNFTEAIETSEKALQLSNQLKTVNDKSRELKAKLYYNLALVHNNKFLNIPQKEYQYTLEAEKTLAEMRSPDIEHLILTYRRLGLFERDYKNYRRAQGYMDKAMRLYEKHKDELRKRVGFKLELALYRANAVILTESEKEDQLLDNIEKVESIAKHNTFDEIEKGNYKSFLSFITRHYLLSKNNLALAKKYHDKALRISLDSHKAPYSLEPFNHEADIDRMTLYLYEKEYQKALTWIHETEKNYKNQINRMLFELKARSLLGLDKLEDSYKAVEQLLTAISEENKNLKFPENPVKKFTAGTSISDVTKLIHLAKSFREYYGKHSIEEEKLYWMALAQFEKNIANTPLNKGLKSSFDKIISGLIVVALDREFSPEENIRLLTFMETVTSQELIHSFLLKRELAGNTKLYKLVEEEQYIRSYITFLKKELQKSKEEDLEQQLFEKETALKKINEQLTEEYKLNNLFAVSDIDIASTANKNILKFKVIGEKLFKIRLYKGKVSYQKIDNYPVLKQEIEEYLSLINNLEAPVSILKKQGDILYKKLFIDDFNEAVSAVIIPDDILYYLPFELLVKDNQYLVENHIISYASSFYFLQDEDVSNTGTKYKRAAFFAPRYSGGVQESLIAVRGAPYSLIGAQEEVSEIAKFISGKVYEGDLASKTNFKSLEKNVSILHLAMHSNLNEEDPELSTLMFSDSEQDYEMHISELYGLNFNADLAVLSACNTGIGGFKDGGNLISMRRAFTTAGVSSTVASLWNAPDQSTKEIMVFFYKNLQQGHDKATALQQAKLSYLKNTKDENLKHPFYWAGFILSGDKSPMELSKHPFWKSTSGLIVFSIIIMLILIVFWTKIRKKKADNMAS